MKLHAYCKIFPQITGKEFDDLVADIKAHGLRNPILAFNGEILDGRNRWLACQAAGVEPRFEPFNGDEQAAFNCVISNNMARRHLDTGQRAMVAAEIAKLSPGNINKCLNSSICEEEAAEKMNVSRSSVQAAKRVQKGSKKLAEQVKAGEISLHAADIASRKSFSTSLSFQEQEAAALAAKAVTVPEGSTLQFEVTHGAVVGDSRAKMLLAPDQPESAAQASADVEVAADIAVSPHAVAKLDATLPPEQRVAVMDALAAAQGSVDVQGDAKLLAETWLATAAGREWLAVKLAETLITTADVQAWLAGTDAGREFDAGLRLRYKDESIGNMEPLTGAEVDLWCSGCEEGQGWLANVLAGKSGEKQPTISAKTVTAWVLTSDGKKWLDAFNRQHVTAGMKPEPVDKKATKELADIAAGRMVKVPTGPPFTLSHFKSAMETLTALVPSDADHAKFGDMLSTFAAQQLHEARQRKGVTSAYTS